MKHITLYIGGVAVDLDDNALVQMNYTAEELTNPTVVKNSYSQQVTLQGTPTNNKVFGSMFQLDRRTVSGGSVGVGFSALAKTPFVIYDDTEAIVERGYVKLDEVVRNGSKVEYTVTLFGGLGEFFYSLSYRADGEKMTLADLDYLGEADPSKELDFYINAEAVDAAWNALGLRTNKATNKWQVVNFAPCYNGIPDDFEADKAIFRPAAAGMPTSVTEDGVTYTTNDGWALVELSEEYTEWQTRDLRSYLQRPVVSMRAIVEACADPKNNGGHTVVLDPAFFNNNNPYWVRTWVTLPILRTVEQEQVEATIKASLSFGEVLTATYVDVAVGSSLWGGTSKVQLTIRPTIKLANGGQVLDGDVLSMRGNTVTFFGKIYDVDGVLIGQTNTATISTTDTLATKGSFIYDSTANVGVWDGADVVLTAEALENVSRIVVVVSPSGGAGVVYDEDGDAQALLGYYGESVDGLSFVEYATFINARTGSLITKKMLLSSDNAPADYLLSFCKVFGLHFIYDKGTKTVTIATRNTLYDGEVIDLSERINYGEEVKISPFAFEAKWYDFGFEYEEGAYAEFYALAMGQPYGRQRVNTGYDFDTSDKQVLDGIVFNGACEVLAREKYFVDVAKDGTPVPSVFIDADHKYTLYAGAKTTQVDAPTPTADYAITYWNDTYKTYDKVPKVQFEDDEHGAVEMSDVLLFYRGAIPNYGGFMVTDDSALMGRLNEGEPCWILNGVLPRVYIPSFGRYLYAAGDAQTIERSLDLGTPLEADIPDVRFADGSDIYTQAWRRYLADRYDIDTKVVTCKVQMVGLNVGAELLRKFYYFEGCLWVLNKISNYNLTDYAPMVECEFVKVKSKDNYLEGQIWR